VQPALSFFPVILFSSLRAVDYIGYFSLFEFWSHTKIIDWLIDWLIDWWMDAGVAEFTSSRRAKVIGYYTAPLDSLIDAAGYVVG